MHTRSGYATAGSTASKMPKAANSNSFMMQRTEPAKIANCVRCVSALHPNFSRSPRELSERAV
eukprot:scaffold120669_cov57-Phaeocystis_antarctica.AAC.2